MTLSFKALFLFLSFLHHHSERFLLNVPFKMGKLEWHFGGRSSRQVTTADHPRRRHHPSLPGCMSTLFHFFDFRSSHFTRFIFTNRHPSSFHLSHHPPPLSRASHHGVEAPRNSLELDGASISCLRNKEENLQLPMEVELQIKTRNGNTKSKATEQQLPNNDHDHIIALESPSAKTPNLLARLMGLDILPPTSTYSSCCSHRPNFGSYSLPESPRVSSARLSDVDYYHRRLSLQISSKKENIEFCDEIKREKEKVKKKVVLVDITNYNRKIELEKQKVGRSSQSKAKKFKKTVVDDYESSSSKVVRNDEVMLSKRRNVTPMSISMGKLNEMSQEGEAFGCPTSNNTIVFQAKKEASSPATRLVSREQPCNYPKRKAKPTSGDVRERNDVDNTAIIDGRSSEFKHNKGISTSHKNSTWVVSPSNNPFNPSTFNHQETTALGAEDQRWNRRLLSQMADEVAGEILNKSRKVRRGKKGWELGEEVRERVVKEFSHGKCEVVEDMNALIEKDLEKSKRVTEETEEIVKVVEVHIMDSLLRETVALFSFLPKRSRFHMHFTSPQTLPIF